jgi:tellurite resistance protein TerC
MDIHIIFWVLFFCVVFILLALDLGVFHRKAHAISIKEALKWSVFWISIGLSFSVVIYFIYLTNPTETTPDAKSAVEMYLTGFVLEKMLSVDNLFVFVILLSFFGVKPKDQHHVLFWGILGALIMRGIFIFTGTAAMHAWAPTLYIFGGLLIFTAARMALMEEHEFNPKESRMYRWLKHVLPLSHKHHEGKFFTREKGVLLGTSLLLCLVMVELTDVLFALDSVPAVLGITSDTFIVYTSNVFAILGLRALYFVIAGGVMALKYLKPALVIVLAFIGVKMMISGPYWHLYEIPVIYSLLIVVLILGVGVLVSIISNRGEKHNKQKDDDEKGYNPEKDTIHPPDKKKEDLNQFR